MGFEFMTKGISMEPGLKNFRKTRLGLLRPVLRPALQVVFLLASVFSLLYMDFTLVAVVMAVSLLGGAWFCGWVCPFGSAQDWISALGRRLFKRRLKVPSLIEKYLSWLRYVLLALSLAGFGYTAFFSRPYQNFSGLLAGHTAYVGLAAWTLLALFLAALFAFFSPLPGRFESLPDLHGIPALDLYLFGVWALVIAAAAWTCSRGRD